VWVGGMPHGKPQISGGTSAPAVGPRQGSRHMNQWLSICVCPIPLIDRDGCNMQSMPFSRMAAGVVEIQGGRRAAAGGAHPRSCSCCIRCCQWSIAGPSCCLHVMRRRKRVGPPPSSSRARGVSGRAAHAVLVAAGNPTQTVAPQGQG
jgi:hypothetical protein